MDTEAGGPGKSDAPAPSESSFGALLRRYRTSRGASQAAIAAAASMDRSYVNRLETGERAAPALEAVDALADALHLSTAEADSLLTAAGHLPRSLRALGLADPTLLLLAQRLSDPQLSPAARAALRSAVEAAARHWSDPSPGAPAVVGRARGNATRDAMEGTP